MKKSVSRISPSSANRLRRVNLLKLDWQMRVVPSRFGVKRLKKFSISWDDYFLRQVPVYCFNFSSHWKWGYIFRACAARPVISRIAFVVDDERWWEEGKTRSLNLWILTRFFIRNLGPGIALQFLKILSFWRSTRFFYKQCFFSAQAGFAA